MKHQIEAPLANGEMVIVEVDGAETSARPITPRRGVREFVEEQVVERVGQTFEAALGKVGPAAATIMVMRVISYLSSNGVYSLSLKSDRSLLLSLGA